MISLATICLNEEEFIGHWLHYHYSSFDRILICEGSDRNYPNDTVTRDGLSSDRTAEIIRTFPDPQDKIRFFQYGWAGEKGSTDERVPAKMTLRNVYATHLPAGYVFTLDVDEFLHPNHVGVLIREMDQSPDLNAWAIPQLHLWQSPAFFITGGYADTPHTRLYRWQVGSSYHINHNRPSGPDGRSLAARYKTSELIVHEGQLRAPAIIHYGFCEGKQSMAERYRYYVNRGEAQTRPATLEFRRAAILGATPPGCRVHRYSGFLPIKKSRFPA